MELTDQQRRAAESKAQLIAVIAAAGSGKSTLIAERVKYLLSRGTPPESIAAITFTNQAAHTLSTKIGYQLGAVTTIHGFCLDLLMKYGFKIGFDPDTLVVLDEEQSEEFIDRQCEILKFKGSKEKLRRVMLDGMPTGERFTDEERMAGRIYHTLKRTNTLIFDAILVYGLQLIMAMNGESWCEFNHILCDEVQDFSDLDWNIVEALPIWSRFYVGDPRQSLFEFRAGNPDRLIYLSQMKGVETHYLNDNWRSGHDICNLANKLAERMPEAAYKRMISARYFEGTIEVKEFDTDKQELEWIASLCDGAAGLEDTTLIVRTNDLCEHFQIPGVKVMTYHKAKSTEYNTVILPAFEDGIIPMKSSPLEEERRLAYVGVTRAARCLIITYCKSRQLRWEFAPCERQPSPFIKQMGL